MANSLFEVGVLSPEEEIFCAHLVDMIGQAKGGRVRYTSFLNLREQRIAEIWLKSKRWDSFCFFGGYSGAERQMLCLSGTVLPHEEQFPISVVDITYRQSGGVHLSHRDFLGSLMNLNLKRELIGDILVSEGKGTVFCTPLAERTILEELKQIGRTGVRAERRLGSVELIAAPEYEQREGTVASLRLDAVVAFSLYISREKASELIRSRLVQKNHTLCLSGDMEIKEGDRLSIRGYGKYEVDQIRGTSRKGRIFITVRHYL